MALSSVVRSRGQFILSNLYPKTQLARPTSILHSCTRRNVHSNALSIENSFCAPTLETNLLSFNTAKIESLIRTKFSSLSELCNNLSTWFIKRTYQPSIIRKRRKTGFLSRQKTVGGRRILKRRKQKGRIRLGGC
jgi:large subunit ribosomal protein L34